MRPRQPRDQRARAGVRPPQSQLTGRLLQTNRRVEATDLAPGNSNHPPSDESSGKPTHDSPSLPGRRADEDRLDPGRASLQSLQLEVVHLAAPVIVGVDDLVVEDTQGQVDRVAHPCPMSVMI